MREKTFILTSLVLHVELSKTVKRVYIFFNLNFQIGSYFGAELCSVDINSDGNTDFLLVGAPLFYNPQEKTEGQIYIYALTNEVGCDEGSHSV